MKKLTILFAVFLLSIIVLADLGRLRRLLSIMNRIPYGDKVLHFLLIGTLTYLVATTLVQALPNRDPKLLVLISGFILAVIFTIEEISQGPIPGRDASLKDLLANYAGIAFFGFFSWLSNRRRIS